MEEFPKVDAKTKKIVLTIEHFSKNQANVPTNGIQRFARFSHFFTVTTAKKGACCPQFGLTGLRMAIMEKVRTIGL